MAEYAVGIGGTGSLCLESLVHLCALGLHGDEVPDLKIFIIDQNESCGNVERVKELTSLYMKCRDYLQIGKKEEQVFISDIKCYPEERNTNSMVWVPYREPGALFKHFILGNKATREQKKILSLLCSQEEKDISLEEGFKGHPNVGSVVMALQVEEAFRGERYFGPLVSEIMDRLANGVKMFVFSSLFGGMGAAGFPILGQKLKRVFEEDEGFNLGGMPLLPYFGFKKGTEKGAHARTEDFLLVCKEALKYYAEGNQWTKYYDALYILGDDFLDKLDRDFHSHGREQSNPSHYIEMMSALACLQFLSKEEAIYGLRKLTRKKRKDVFFKDLPDEKILEHILFFTSFSIAFGLFYKMIIDPRFEGYRKNFRWYCRHFKDRELIEQTDKERLRTVSDFTQKHLNWIKDIHHTEAGGKKIKLFRDNLFEDTDPENKLRDLLYFGESAEERDLAPLYPRTGKDWAFTDLLEIMNSNGIKINDNKTKPVAKFVDLLYKSVVVFCQRNYNLKQALK